jgi:glycine/D-amino acid oxidase-like deaminating enzyme
MPELRLGKPIWLPSAAARRRQTYGALHGHHEVDVAIVGGGLTGSVVAALFAEAGVRIAVLERGRVGHGSTAASTALLLQQPDKGLVDLGRRYGTAASRRIWRLSHGAVGDFVDTLQRLRIECDLVACDAVYYTSKAERLRELRSEHRSRHAAGFKGTWLTSAALRRLTGISGHGAIRTSGNAQLDPFKACLGLLRFARGAGARIYERSEIVTIEQARDGVRVVSRGGTVTAARVIVATGYATPEFQPLVGRFRLHHTYVLATNPIDGRQRKNLGVGTMMFWDTDRPYHYGRWTPDKRLLLGGGDRPVVAERLREAAFRKATRDLREHFETVLPPIAEVGIDYAWEGLFAMTPDGLPYIGPHRRYPRHLFALGYGGNGMTFGFLAARMLLEQWRGITSPDHQLFAFGRHK